MSVFTCECCINDFPVALREVHHKHPRELGKPEWAEHCDDPRNLATICEHCHSIVHKSAAMVLKSVDPQELLNAVYGDNRVAIDNALTLASIIVKASANRTVEDHRNTQNVTVPIDFEFYNLEVKTAAKSAGMTVAEFMKQAIIDQTVRVNGAHAAHALQQRNDNVSLLPSASKVRVEPAKRRR